MALVAASDSAALATPAERSGNLIRPPATVRRHRIVLRIAKPRDGYTSFPGATEGAGLRKAKMVWQLTAAGIMTPNGTWTVRTRP